MFEEAGGKIHGKKKKNQVIFQTLLNRILFRMKDVCKQGLEK